MAEFINGPIRLDSSLWKLIDSALWGDLELALSLHEGYPTLLGRACKGQSQDPRNNQHKCSPQELCPFLSKFPPKPYSGPT